jgi:hypothetical protein
MAPSILPVIQLLTRLWIICYFLYLGIPVYEKSYLFGDNKSMVDSSMMLTEISRLQD